MSGFGGGGFPNNSTSNNNNSTPVWGSGGGVVGQQQQQPAPPSSSFPSFASPAAPTTRTVSSTVGAFGQASSSVPFGQAAPSAFGQAAAAPAVPLFGQQQLQASPFGQPATHFGHPAPSNSFGNSSNNNNNTNNPFASPAAVTNNNTNNNHHHGPPPLTPFGAAATTNAAPPVIAHPSIVSTSTSTIMFGTSASIAAPPATTPMMTQPQQQQPHAAAPFHSSGGGGMLFGGGPSSASSTASGFGNSGFHNDSSFSTNNNNTSFAPANNNNNNHATSFHANNNNPFGGGATTSSSSTALAFGTSNNLANANNNIMMSSMMNHNDNNNNDDADMKSPVPSNANSPVMMMNHNNHTIMGSDHDAQQQQQQAPKSSSSSGRTPFGGPPPTWQSSTTTTNPADGNTANKNITWSAASSASNHTNNTTNKEVDNTKLALLKAKLAEKKKRIEAKKAKAAVAAAGSDGGPNNNNHNASAAAAPAKSRHLSAATTTSNDGDNDDNNKDSSKLLSLAQRNARRFGNKSSSSPTTTTPSSSSYMPSTKRSMPSSATTTTTTTSSQDPVRRQERETLDSAVSLVGTCQYMCPDEELERRDRESDIQLLERPHPQVHPADWMYRHTVIKRFRRSAADYTLNVPEWVRPPDVLERVCGYLEEWIMEKDRQGPDPRFPGSGVPPSLDVYQFIWDRTRMVRKDFTLQNYVGTGGNCDARAVRCHERIARWHAMCEHQLSHIIEYQRNQSVQNIQELGQTMKTLNQFYDDSLQRSTVEVPDKNGHETRTNLQGFTHGCESDSVQGSSPVDYNDSALINSVETNRLNKRLLGAHVTAASSAAASRHGTSEAEMRGMYILLTIDNDGGMEVLKYAGRLFSECRHMYDSAPVQLAMRIYKAKRELNYARFFSILRAPSTPYLYACIMFKHVRFMRETAFKIMSKTYGGVSRETQESVYDQYPLKELGRLLCFEDLDEARAACQHYGITVKEMKLKSPTKTTVAEIIFWKKSSFKIPKDPVKGTVITLRPRKMLRTIECKIHGATRLAICRGEVSNHQGSTSNVNPPNAIGSKTGVASPKPNAAEKSREQDAAFLAVKQQENERQEREAVQQQQQAETIKAEEAQKKRQKEEEECKRLAEIERKEVVAAQRQAEIERQQHERKLEEERERVRIQAKQEEIRAQQAAEEKLRKLKERQRLEALALQEKQRKEQEMQRKLQEERARHEREQKLIREKKALELKREREETAKRLALEQEIVNVRKEKERAARLELQRWTKEVNDAKKKLFLLRWKAKLPVSVLAEEEVERSLSCTGPSVTSVSRSLYHSITQRGHDHSASLAKGTRGTDTRAALESMLKRETLEVDLSRLLTVAILDQKLGRSEENSDAKVWLVKFGIFLPKSKNMQVHAYTELLTRWLNKVFATATIHSASKEKIEVRTMFTTETSSTPCDVALFVIPPTSTRAPLADLELRELSSRVARNTPRVVLSITEEFHRPSLDAANAKLATALSGSFDHVAVVSNIGTDDCKIVDALRLSSERLLSALDPHTLKLVKRLAVEELVCQCIIGALQEHGHVKRRVEVSALCEIVFHHVVSALKELQNFATTISLSWPDNRFFTRGVCPKYFGNVGLPQNWKSSSSSSDQTSAALASFANTLSLEFQLSVASLVRNAPDSVRKKCFTLVEVREYNECMQAALSWKKDGLEPWENDHYLYFEQSTFHSLHTKVRTNVEQAIQTLRPVEFISDDNDMSWPALASAPLFDSPRPQQPANKQTMTAPKTPWTEPSPKRSLAVSNPVNSAEKSVSTLTPGVFVSPKRRRRNSSQRAPSENVADSLDFTATLEALASGDLAQDMIIGKTTLSSLLRPNPQ